MERRGAGGADRPHTPDTAQATRYTTTNAYAADGALASTTIADGRPRTVGYASDLDGRIVRRDEADGNAATGDPHAVWYRFDGRQMGSATNDARGGGGDYAGSVDDRQATGGAGAFRLGAGGGLYESEFAQGPAGIDSYETGSEAGSYTVRGGDTLAGIAQQLWGDAGLWYKLAEANGLGAGTALAAGQSLRLPAGVLRSAYSDATLTPYDHAGAIGDIQPTTPQPPAPRGSSHGKKHCGGFGTVLLAVVAVAVTAIVAGPASAGLATFFNGGAAAAAGSAAAIAGGVAGGAVAGVAGSVASQAVGVATGIQEKFSWKGVALAGIGAGVGGGLGAAGAFGTGFAAAVARGAVGSAATQGIGVATGLQSKFDFAGVAAAGVGAGVGHLVGGGLPGLKADNSLANHFAHLGTGTANALANAATRSLIDGSDFGDNVLAALPDVIGQTVGNALVNGVSGSGRMSPAEQGLVTQAQASAAASGQASSAREEPLGYDGLSGVLSDETLANGIVITALRQDAVYQPGIGDPYLFLIQRGSNPRARMGGNGGPPFYDPMTLRQVVGPAINTPAGPVLGLVDGLFDLTGPASRLVTDFYQAQRDQLIGQIKTLDPSWFYASLGEPTTRQGQLNSLNDLRAQRAATIYTKTGQAGPLQVETLRAMQTFVDEGYAEGLRRYDAGQLSQKLSRNEAIGNFVDKYSRDNIRDWYNIYRVSIAPGQPVRVNNRASAPDGSYRIPDVRVGNAAFDATLSLKIASTPQVRGFFGASFQPRNVIVVRPTQMGGSYIIPKGR